MGSEGHSAAKMSQASGTSDLKQSNRLVLFYFSKKSQASENKPLLMKPKPETAQ